MRYRSFFFKISLYTSSLFLVVLMLIFVQYKAYPKALDK